MSKFIHRALMPQVDFDDLPRLVKDAWGIHDNAPGVSFEVVDPHLLTSHQYVHHDRALAMLPEHALKPVLISNDGGVLDGNHRWYRAQQRHEYLNAIVLNTTFDDAIDWLATLPYVYHIDKKTPLRN